AEATERVLLREREVVGNRLDEHEPLLLPILAQQPDAAAPALARCAGAWQSAKNHHLAGVASLHSDNRPQQVRSAGRDQPGESENLTRTDLQSRALQPRRTGEVPAGEHDVTL